jgi:hypothetical protein
MQRQIGYEEPIRHYPSRLYLGFGCAGGTGVARLLAIRNAAAQRVYPPPYIFSRNKLSRRNGAALPRQQNRRPACDNAGIVPAPYRKALPFGLVLRSVRPGRWQVILNVMAAARDKPGHRRCAGVHAVPRIDTARGGWPAGRSQDGRVTGPATTVPADHVACLCGYPSATCLARGTGNTGCRMQ